MKCICDKCMNFPCGEETNMIIVCCDFEEKPKVHTNADRIRSMSDYDLADWIANILTCHGAMSSSKEFDFDRYCIDCPLNKCCNDQPSDNIEDWLKSPVEEVDNG